jgi:colanic acid biosynthesis glycosyl transferase WcaI
MDLNPDQLIAMGVVRARSMLARVLDAANRYVARRARAIVVLDRFMADRLLGKVHRIADVLPPWAHENHIDEAAADGARFRARHGLQERFVVMYSGNHSPANPLTTILDAAVDLRGEEAIRFVFVGGGRAKQEVENYRTKYGLTNVVSLPYQPLNELGDVLRAADVHVVSIGEAMVGIIHPSKVYGAMAAARPVLYLGPRRSPIGELLEVYGCGWQIAHGDVKEAVKVIRELAVAPRAVLTAKANRGRAAIENDLAQRNLCGRFCDIVEAAFSTTAHPDPAAVLPAALR